MSSFSLRVIDTLFKDPLVPFRKGMENIRDGYYDQDLSLDERIARGVVGLFQLTPMLNYVVYEQTKDCFGVKLSAPSSLDVPTQNKIPKDAREQVAKNKNLVALVHKVGIDRIGKIFKEGKLIPSNKSSLTKGIRTPTVFLQAVTKLTLDRPNVTQFRVLSDEELAIYQSINISKDDSLKDLQRVVLVFKLSLLERDDYHCNDGWSYGRMSSNLSYSPSQIDKFCDVVCSNESKEQGKSLMNNEVVFRNEISLKSLRSIIVHSSEKAELLKILADIPIPDAIPSWESIIQVRKSE